MSNQKKDAGSPAQNRLSLDEMIDIYHSLHKVMKNEFPGLFLKNLEPIKKPADLSPNLVIKVLSRTKIKPTEVGGWLYKNGITSTSKHVSGNGDDVIKIDLTLISNQDAFKKLFSSNSVVVKESKEGSVPESISKNAVNSVLTNDENCHPSEGDLVLDSSIKEKEMIQDKLELTEADIILNGIVATDELIKQNTLTHIVINNWFRKVFGLGNQTSKRALSAFAAFPSGKALFYSVPRFTKDWEDSIHGQIFKKFESGEYKDFPDCFGRYEVSQKPRGFKFYLDENKIKKEVVSSDVIVVEQVQKVVEPSLQDDFIELMKKHGMIQNIKTLEEYSENELLDCLCNKTTTGNIVKYLMNRGYLEEISFKNSVLFEIIK